MGELYDKLWLAAQAAGAFGSLLALGYAYICRQDLIDERAERRRLQAEQKAIYEGLAERTLHTINAATVVMGGFSDVARQLTTLVKPNDPGK